MVPPSYSVQTCARLAVCPSRGGFTSNAPQSRWSSGASRSRRRLVLGQVSVCVSPFRATSRRDAPCWFAHLALGARLSGAGLTVGASEAGYTVHVGDRLLLTEGCHGGYQKPRPRLCFCVLLVWLLDASESLRRVVGFLKGSFFSVRSAEAVSVGVSSASA